MKHNRILLVCACVVLLLQANQFQPLKAQDLATSLTATDYQPAYDQTRTLGVDIHALAFFKNNEYGGDQATGYTLPGFWLQPRLSWQPLDAIRLEAGFHATVFNGASKYPCFAYHDIVRWKGSQYQRGAHILPFLRARAHLQGLTFVLGNIYGGANHGLVEPLMNAEVNLSQDPETGFQLLADRPHYHLDAWINWQSFIFREETHQEAFTVGISQRIRLNAQPSPLHFYIPVDVLIQHRGGEIDATNMGVQTIDNAALGLGLRWNNNQRVFKGLTAEVMALGCWQQTGNLWPFDTGVAAAATLSADLFGRSGLLRGNNSYGQAGALRLFGTVVYAKDFCPIYGAPFFSTFSTKTGGRFASVFTPHLGVEWSHTFARDYVLGAKLDTYLCFTGKETLPLSSVAVSPATDPVPAEMTASPLVPTSRPSAFNNNFAFGIFLRCSPHFLVKNFNK